MTEENEEVWLFDSLEVDEDGFVTGSAYTRQKDGVTVDAVVHSYEYDDGEAMNHVPHIVVSDEDGHILAEPHSHDTSNPEEAIDRVKKTGENVYNHLENYV